MILAQDLNEVSVWDIYQNLGWRLPARVKGNEDWEVELASRLDDIDKSTRKGLEEDLETLFKRTNSSGENLAVVKEEKP